MRLQRLLNPRSLAFVGGAECAVAIERTRALGFAGRIWAVNPRRKHLGGIATVPAVSDIDGSPDAAFIALPRAATPGVISDLHALGCGGAVIYAAGFAESGEHSLQQALLASAAGMPLLGPNCYGFINAASRVALWPDEHGLLPLDRGVAIVTQSGNIGCNLTMLQRGLPLAALLTLGNQADVDIAEAVEALALDPRVTAIGLHIEGLRDVAAFAAAAAVAREQDKPIVALKTGRSPQGARIALSHTASLAGADRLCDALFERYGIARVPTLTSLVEALKLLHFGGPLPGRNLLSLSCSGGEAALVADLAAERGLSFPPFPETVARRLATTLDDLVTIDNPLDYHTFIWGRREQLENTFAAALDGQFDAAMLILDTPTHPAMKPDAWLLTARAFIEAQRRTGARAMVVASLPEGMPPALADELGRAGIAPLVGIDDALLALDAAAFIGAQSQLPAAQAPWSPAVVRGASAAGLPCAFETLSELEAKRLLARFGLDVPAAVECSMADAPRAAEQMGFPVAVKIANESIAHKSDVGGVALSLGLPMPSRQQLHAWPRSVIGCWSSAWSTTRLPNSSWASCAIRSSAWRCCWALAGCGRAGVRYGDPAAAGDPCRHRARAAKAQGLATRGGLSWPPRGRGRRRARHRSRDRVRRRASRPTRRTRHQPTASAARAGGRRGCADQAQDRVTDPAHMPTRIP